MTTPVGRDIGESFPTMRNAVVDLFLVRICFVVGLANALGDDLGIASPVTQVLAVSTLHTGGVLQQLPAQGTAHNVVELLIDEFVALLLRDNFLLLTDGTLTIKPNVVHAAVTGVFN